MARLRQPTGVKDGRGRDQSTNVRDRRATLGPPEGARPGPVPTQARRCVSPAALSGRGRGGRREFALGRVSGLRRGVGVGLGLGTPPSGTRREGGVSVLGSASPATFFLDTVRRNRATS